MSKMGKAILESLADDVVAIMEKEGYFKPGCTKDPMKDRRLWRKIERISKAKNERMFAALEFD